MKRHVLMAPADDAGSAGGAGASNVETPATPSADDLAKLKADNAALQKQLADIAASQTTAAKAADAARKKELEEQGQHKTLAEQLKAEKAALEAKLAALEPDANLGKTFREKTLASITEAAKTMSADDKVILDSINDLDAKAAFVARISGAAKPATGTQPAGAKVASTSTAIDFATAWATPAAWAEAKARDPEGAAKWFKSRSSGGGVSSVTSLSSLTRAPTKTA